MAPKLALRREPQILPPTMTLFRASLTPLFFLLVATSACSAKTWYVAGAGNDAHDGIRAGSAFRTLQKAAGLVEPGDTVMIDNGIYTAPQTQSDSAVLTVTRSGRRDAWITWKAAPGAKPEIRPIGWTGILVTACYQIFDGITVIGANDSITLLDAINDAKNTQASGRYNTNGIFVNGRQRGPEEKPHHVILRNCTVGKCPGGGITAIETDYITVEDCQVFDNAWFMRYAGSGITTLTNWRFDDAPGYHMIFQRNRVWNNKTQVSWEKIGKLSDGNGILMDVSDQEESGATNVNGDAVLKPGSTGAAVAPTPTPALKPKRPEWKGRTLITNNLSAYNGGAGIGTFRTKHVDIINNTTYWNGQIVGYAEVYGNRSDDIVILNNIMVPRPAGKVTSNSHNGKIRWDYNLYSEKQDLVTGPHDIVADPHFIRIKLDLAEADFHLAAGSGGLDSGLAELMPPTDLAGKKRPAGKGVDRGAFEQE